MKLLKVGIVILIAGMFAVSSCKKHEDPAPVHHPAVTHLDSVKTLFSGTWTFQSVTFIQNGVSATTSNCAKTQIASAGFADDNWRLADEPNISFKSEIMAVYTDPCNKANIAMDISATENSDGTVNVVLKDQKENYVTQRYLISDSDITLTHFKAYAINSYNYTVIYEFTRN